MYRLKNPHSLPETFDCGKGLYIYLDPGQPVLHWGANRFKQSTNPSRNTNIHITVVDTLHQVTASSTYDLSTIYLQNAQWRDNNETYSMQWKHGNDDITIIAPCGFAINFDELQPLLDKALKVRRIADITIVFDNDDPQVVYVNDVQYLPAEERESATCSDVITCGGTDFTIIAPNDFTINGEDLKFMLENLQNVGRINDDSEATSAQTVSEDHLHVCLTLLDSNYVPEYVLYSNYDRSPGHIIFNSRKMCSLGSPVGDGFERDDFQLSLSRLAALFHRWMILMMELGYSFPDEIYVQMDTHNWSFELDV